MHNKLNAVVWACILSLAAVGCQCVHCGKQTGQPDVEQEAVTAKPLPLLKYAYTEKPEDAAVREKLLRTLVKLDGKEHSLAEYISFISKATGLRIDVRWHTLKAVDINREDRFAIASGQVTAEMALQDVLRAAGGEEVRLAYKNHESQVIVTTAEHLAYETEIRVYDIWPFYAHSLNIVPNYHDETDDIYEPAHDDGQILMCGDDDGFDKIPMSELYLRLMDIIRNSVDPDGWRTGGGLSSSMEEINGLLVINTTPRQHRQVVTLFNKLAEALNKRNELYK